MVTFVVNTVGNLKFHWSKKRSDPLKGPVNLRNLITSLITSLFKLLELFVEPYSKLATFSVVCNFEKDGSSL